MKLGIFFALTLSYFNAAIAVTELQCMEKTITVNGKKATVLAIAQSDGTLGIQAQKGALFDVVLKNPMRVPTSIHWHGLILPNNQDGVAFITQFPIYPDTVYAYRFPLIQSGTFWMHAHYGLQEQLQLSAPLIIHDAEDKLLADQEVVLFLSDFSFKTPSEIYQELRCSKSKMHMGPHDIFDVKYDAFLTNYRTLEDPEIVKIETNRKVRLRITNGSSATNFFISLGTLKGVLIAVDGNKIEPLQASEFELAVAQRVDIIVTIPQEGEFFPILATGEGTNKQTGLILGKKETGFTTLSGVLSERIGPFTNAQESKLHALYPLVKRAVDNRIIVELGGDMASYTWTMNGQSWPESTPLIVEEGQRVEIVFKNRTSMSHPMHLHGHVFQVTAIDEKPVNGAMRDTVLVMPHSTLTIQFDANNPGVWPFHCHILYHLEAGMFTVLRYK